MDYYILYGDFWKKKKITSKLLQIGVVNSFDKWKKKLNLYWVSKSALQEGKAKIWDFFGASTIKNREKSRRFR